MLLHSRSIRFTVAVIGFFALGIVGAIEGLPPHICSKRALLGAIITYWAASAVTWAIDTILTRAMIANHIAKDNTGDDEN